jgi:uncharacterized protein YkwD
MPPSAPSEEVPLPPPPLPHDAPVHARKKKAKKRLIVLVISLAAMGLALWYFQSSLAVPLQDIALFGSSVETSVVSQLEQSSSTWPVPLKQLVKAPPKKANALTIAGVSQQTNIQRAENGGLPPLSENATLDDVATLRVDDLFANQYFEHVNSSTGQSAITVASSVGYTDLALGENLALGLYAGDAGVVTAWMNSPGHRANILDAHFTQIGVAVREGTFDGQETWIAVQVFGRPASDCPAPDPNLKTSIDLSENQIATMATELQSEKAAIDAMDPQSGPAYNAQVEDYNNLVAQYNNLTAKTKTAIDLYDSQVNAFNSCLGK